ncbi:HNH endonuclease signature motif containing protein [Cellulomonas fimi]|uniref:DUF222 domain-containing protein n=1 Tax=Cellulomonas fimi TaxID=1708 RepID=A0A7Y0LYK2_CELFI|nr:HNH endonuclease signature motif containing protein [Cellulomonas fimi]NMR20270.1 DUF222 domain-containing protein [Cellulomonas fimi]
MPTGEVIVAGPAPAVGHSTAVAHARSVGAVVVRLAAESGTAAGWSAGERREVLEQLDRAIDGLAAVRAAVLVAERQSESWRGSGDRSFEAWRGRTSRAGQRSAQAQVRQAEQLDAVPAVVAAVTAGRISLEHATTIAKVAGAGTPAQRDATRSPAGQAHLLELAEHLDAGTFATTAARWAATVDPAGLERDHQAQRAERYLHVTHTPHGTLVKGRLDSMAGHRLTLALEAVTARPAADDDRDPGQRRADALDTVAERILTLKDSKPGAHVPPHVSLILTETTWLAARAERDRRRRALGSGDAPAEDAGVSGRHDGHPSSRDSSSYLPATLEDGAPVPVSELAAALCDCELTRIVIDAAGAPLDLGRSERVFTGIQRRAVIARDRECAWPQCGAHARWCQVHHITWWDRDDGPTSVDNGVLLCSFHHHEVHRRDLTITRRGAQATMGRTASTRDHGTMARVHYEFHDSAGRRLAAPPRRDGEPPPVGDASRGSPPPGVGELDFTPITDPVTGMTVPTFLVASA